MWNVLVTLAENRIVKRAAAAVLTILVEELVRLSGRR